MKKIAESVKGKKLETSRTKKNLIWCFIIAAMLLSGLYRVTYGAETTVTIGTNVEITYNDLTREATIASTDEIGTIDKIMLKTFGNYYDIKTLTITNKVYAPEDSSELFAQMSVEEINGLSNLDTSNATNMNNMFDGCTAISTIDLSSFIIPNDVTGFFDGCLNLNNVTTPAESTGIVELPGNFYNTSDEDDTNIYTDTFVTSTEGSVNLKRCFVIKYLENKETDSAYENIKLVNETYTIDENTFEGKEGYTFKNWNTTTNGEGTTYEAGQEYTENADLELYAQWEANEYTVLLDSQDATTEGTRVVTATYDAKLPEIEIPTKDGFEFGGYFLGENGTDKQYYSSQGTSSNNWDILEEKTLYAYWISEDASPKYKIEYYEQDIFDKNQYYINDELTETRIATVGEVITVDQTDIKPIYGFTYNSEKTDELSGTIVEGETLVLKVYYDRSTYTITLHENEGTILEGNNVIEYIYEEEKHLPTTDEITRDGYNFLGWYDNEELEGNSINVIDTKNAGNKEYWAKWEKNTFTVTFINTDVNATEENKQEVQEVKRREGAVAPEWEKEGYTLSWDKDISHIEEDMTVNTVWTAKTNIEYKIEYYKQNLENKEQYDIDETLTETRTGTIDEETTVDEKDIKDLIGFSQNTEKIDELTGIVPIKGMLRLKVYYDRENYAVILHENEGIIDEGANITEYTYGQEVVLPTEEITKEDYIFLGWFNNEDLEGEAVTEIFPEETGNKEYWAGWRKNVYTVTFINTDENANEESRETTQKVVRGEDALAPEWTKDGYTLSWSRSYQFVTEDIIINTVWTPRTDMEYKIQFLKQNIENKEQYDIDEESTITAIGTVGEEVSIEEYGAKVFRGFEQNTEKTDEFSGVIPATGELILKVYYDREKYTIILHENDGIIAEDKNVTEYTYGEEKYLPNANEITKDGYNFLGWFDNEELIGEPVTKITEDETGTREYWTKWKEDTVTVTFVNTDEDAEEENKENIQTIIKGGNAVAPEWIKEGYTLSWDKEFSNVTEDITVNAIWTENVIIITDVDYKIEYYVQNSENREQYDLIEELTEKRTGTIGETVNVEDEDIKSIEGYVLNTEKTEEIAGLLTTEEMLVLKVYYNIEEYTVTFINTDENAAEENRENVQTVARGASAVEPEWIKEGYTLSWDKEFTNITEDITVNTIWTKNEVTEDVEYKIEYYLQNEDKETYTKIEEDTQIKHGKNNEVVSVKDEDIKAYQGYLFDTKKVEELTGTIKTDGSLVLKVYYYKATYIRRIEVGLGRDENGDGVEDKLVISIGGVDGEDIILPTDIIRPGYKIEGWYTNSRFDGEPITVIRAERLQNTPLYIKWVEKPYTITLNTNDGIINSGNVEEYNYKNEVILPTDVTKTGYLFAGWYDNEELKGNRVEKIESGDAGDKVYWAKWIPLLNSKYYIVHKIENLEDEEFTEVERFEYSGITNTVVILNDENLPSVVRDYIGFTFDKTINPEELENTINAEGTMELVLYYRRNIYSIEFQTNDGIMNGEYIERYRIGERIELPTEIEKEGFIFKGWYDNSEFYGDAITIISEGEYGDKIFYAKWEEIQETPIVSEEYAIDQEKNIISKITPNTTIDEFLENLEVNGTITSILDKDNNEILGNISKNIGTSSKVIVESEGQENVYDIVVTGDMTGDGKITASDLTSINKHMVGIKMLDGLFAQAGDINYDNKITASDLTKINKAIIGLANF